LRRRDFIKGAALSAGGVLAGTARARSAPARERADSLLALFENGPNSLDFHAVGANRLVYEVVWNSYDRLLAFGVKQAASGCPPDSAAFRFPVDAAGVFSGRLFTFPLRSTKIRVRHRGRA
jgi:hypothetical protein